MIQNGEEAKIMMSAKINPSRLNHGRREKIKSNFYTHTLLWCLNMFFEGLNDLHKTFSGTTKKCENKNLTCARDGKC